MIFYERGAEYEEHIIRAPFLSITISTQPNISGAYTKYIEFPGFFFGRNYMGAELKIFGRIIWSTKMNQKWKYFWRGFWYGIRHPIRSPLELFGVLKHPEDESGK